VSAARHWLIKDAPGCSAVPGTHSFRGGPEPIARLSRRIKPAACGCRPAGEGRTLRSSRLSFLGQRRGSSRNSSHFHSMFLPLPRTRLQATRDPKAQRRRACPEYVEGPALSTSKGPNEKMIEPRTRRTVTDCKFGIMAFSSITPHFQSKNPESQKARKPNLFCQGPDAVPPSVITRTGLLGIDHRLQLRPDRDGLLS